MKLELQGEGEKRARSWIVRGKLAANEGCRTFPGIYMAAGTSATSGVPEGDSGRAAVASSSPPGKGAGAKARGAQVEEGASRRPGTKLDLLYTTGKDNK